MVEEKTETKKKKEVTKKVPLTNEQRRFAQLRDDEAKVLDITLAAQLKAAELELELGLPNRKHQEAIDNIKENIKRNKLNRKYWAQQIREGTEVRQ